METFHHHREPRTVEMTHAKRDDTIRPKKPTLGGRIIQIALGLVGCHYINGAYGATPGRNDGASCRPGGIQLVADPKRLDPNKQTDKTKDLAVLAAQMFVKRHCICGGNYNNKKILGGGCRPALPSDWDLNNYLASLKGKNPMAWTNYYGHFTPRRVYGPARGGDIGGKLVWGQSCKDIRHFDCIGFISFCLSQATGKEALQLEIAQWRTPHQLGSKVYDLSVGRKPETLMDGDILVKADHHIAWVAANGTIIEAADTDLGVVAKGQFELDKSPGAWTHLVRLPL